MNESNGLDPMVQRQLEGNHRASQLQRWRRLGELLTERERAEALAHYELDVIFDRLPEHERDSTLGSIEEDRDWPGAADRRREEAAETQRRFEEEQRTGEAAIRAAEDELQRTRARTISMYEQVRLEEAKQAEQGERERVAEQERRREQERERLRKKRDDLAAPRG